MATRSAIAVQYGETFRAVYCHWDGYLEGVGATLRNHYNVRSKLSNLIALGSISSLGEELGEQHSFDARRGEAIPETWTTFYTRDRGEEDQSWRMFHSKEELVDYYDGCGCEYFYLMDTDENWWVKSYNSGWVSLDFALADELIDLGLTAA
jgi:hypothetical protein